jgi:hypothetical protein
MKFSWRDVWEQARFFYGISHRAEAISAMQHRMYREPLLAAEKAADPLTLAPYGFTAYSQGDDDGIIEEIFRRIGAVNREFIDFGCADGLENNTTYLLLTGWRGFWIDGDSANIATVRDNFGDFLKSGHLKLLEAFITRENIDDLLRQSGLSEEPDLLSIDIDGNDYWVWEAIDAIRPRVVAIEYNGTFRPPHKVVQSYNPAHQWHSDSYFGASLKALEALGARKGYDLAGCNFAGLNAFFVRRDLAGDKFSKPFTAEHHYRECLYDAFVRGYSRHRKAVGRYELL